MLFLLHESASGLGLLEVIEADDVASGVEEAMLAQADFSRFARMVRLKAFAPFSSAEHALENANAVSEGVITDYLREFVEANLPKPAGKPGSSKKTKTAADVDGAVQLGVHDQKTAQALHDAVGVRTGVAINADARSAELLRGVRCHFERLIDGLKAGDLAKAQLGLAHSYSRSKVKFNVNRSETGILNSIALLDTLDKDINTFAMRVREWYSWHFPELIKIAPDNIQYARLVRVVRNKADLSEESLPAITAVVMDEAVAQDILDAARSSMGTDISEVDLVNIEGFSRRVVELAEYRTSLQTYLASKMSAVAPNLGCLLGDTVAARLIAHAGSLTNLAKYPASTVQILGAEKALFRALKTKGKTPKYGLLYVRVPRQPPRAPQAGWARPHVCLSPEGHGGSLVAVDVPVFCMTLVLTPLSRAVFVCLLHTAFSFLMLAVILVSCASTSGAGRPLCPFAFLFFCAAPISSPFCLPSLPPAQHSSFIGRAKLKNKGRISRYLANKCSIASRVDCFSDAATDVFGRMLRDQVDERLKFYDTGAAPRKNADVMAAAIAEAEAVADAAPPVDAMDDGSDEDASNAEAAAAAPVTPAAKPSSKKTDKGSSKKKDEEARTPKSSSKKDKKRAREEGAEGKDKSAKKSSAKKSKRAAAVVA